MTEIKCSLGIRIKESEDPLVAAGLLDAAVSQECKRIPIAWDLRERESKASR